MSDIHQTRRFLDDYANGFDVVAELSKIVGSEIRELLIGSNVSLHVVSARPKSVASIRAKLLRKSYANPAAELTDLIGVRVIVYRREDVDRVAELIKKKWGVIKKYSVDKRSALGLREFGYRSFHLICRVSSISAYKASIRAPRFFEIQIRTLLEHAWAEIEHAVVYKSGANLPEEVTRRFASAAGVLELVENEFIELATDVSGLIDGFVEVYESGDRSGPLDVPRLSAVLEVVWPGGISFRQGASTGKPFPQGIEQLLVLALKRLGIKSVSAFVSAIDDKDFRRTLRAHAASEGIGISETSHLAICILLIGSRRKSYLGVYFPEFLTLSVSRSLD